MSINAADPMVRTANGKIKLIALINNNYPKVEYSRPKKLKDTKNRRQRKSGE
jgi:hypothetical protein